MAFIRAFFDRAVDGIAASNGAERIAIADEPADGQTVWPPMFWFMF